MNKLTFFLVVLTCVELIHSQARRDIVVDNIAVYRGNDQWEWTIFIKSTPNILESIEYVQYTLHPTFYEPVQKVYKTTEPDHPFGLTRTGWGVFEVPVKVVFRNGEQQTFRYLLRFQQASQASRCRPPFVVDQRHYVRVDDELFKTDIYVYIGEVHRSTSNPFFAAILLGDQSTWNKEGTLKQSEFDSKAKRIAENHRWSSRLRDIGDSLAFQDNGRPFHLEVVNVASAPNNARKVTLRICEN